jgi:hypothetical protein
MKRYLSAITLIEASLSERPIDAVAMLQKVDREAIDNDARRSKAGTPESFSVTNALMPEERFSHLPQKEKAALDEIHQYLVQAPRKALKRLLPLKDAYSDVPVIYNLLFNAYKLLGQHEQSHAILLEMRKRFPDYLFGKLAMIEYLLTHGKPREVPQVLDSDFELAHHVRRPGGLCHISEARYFFYQTGLYFLRVNQTARAIMHFFILHDLEPDAQTTQLLAREIVHKEIDQLKARMRRRKTP